jgi:sulfur relay (sulfurtransferase) complex TusBCD TusD component (DsrE family)
MEEFIISKTREIFSKAIKRFSKNDKIEQDNVAILLELVEENGEKEVGYQICHNYLSNRRTTIKEILGYKTIDMSGFSVIVPPHIKDIINKQEKKLESKNVEICVYLNREDEEREEVSYFLYKDGVFLNKVELIELLK